MGLHLAVDARVLRPPLTGVGRYTLAMLRAMAAHPSQPRLTCFVDDRSVWELHSWPGCCTALQAPGALESHPWGDIRHQWGMPRAVARLDPPADWFWGPAFQVPWRRKFPCRRVVTLHDLAAFVHPGTMPAKFAWYLRAVVRRSVRAAGRIVAVSHATRDAAVRELRLDPVRIAVIGEAPLLGDSTEPRRPGALAEGVDRFLLFVGALEPRKNIPFLLDVFEELGRRGDNRALLLCGPPGWKNRPILARLAASPRAGNIHRLDFVDDGGLRWLYGHAEVLLMPSLDEGFGLPPLEAAAFGTPSLVSDRGALPESALSPEFVLPLEADIWVERLLEFRRPSPDRLRAHAARYSWEQAAGAFLGLLGSS